MQFRNQTTKEFVEGVTLVDIATGLPYNPSADGANVTIGAKTDIVATTDIGTFSLISLFKRSLQKLTSIRTSQALAINTVQYLSVGSTSLQSSMVNSSTNRIVISSTVDCWVSIGVNPTAVVATSGSFFLSAGAQSYPIEVFPSVTKIAAIQASTNGHLSIIESA